MSDTQRDKDRAAWAAPAKSAATRRTRRSL